MTKTDGLTLLPPSALLTTGSVDHADWNYKPLLGLISRARFRLMRSLLRGTSGARLLEIGYGSGIFFPELAKYSRELYGIDVHCQPQQVSDLLAASKIKAELVSGGAEQLPWPDAYFDVVVAVSALEFVADLQAVCSEVTRILRPDGRFLVVTPGKSVVLDVGLKVLTGKSAKQDFADRRELILPMLRQHFDVKRELTFPAYGAFLLTCYYALELTAKINLPDQ